MNEHPPDGPEWKWPAGVSRRCVFACLLAVAVGQAPVRALEAPTAANSNGVLRLGFSSSVFVGVNENDAKAATKVWAQTILLEHGATVVAEPTVLNGREAIASAVRNKLVDAVTMTAEEYWVLGGEFMSTNAVLGANGGLATEEYLLLVHRDSNIGRIDDLRGRSLIFFENGRASLAPVWFETLLLKSGLGQTSQFCGRVIQGTKLSQVVLPVFFRQADACVVTRRGFQTMVELNPQVGQQLKTLVSSPAMVPVAFLFRADYSDPVRDRIVAEIEKVHSSVAAQQVLTLFQCENLQVRPVSALDTALELLATHGRLSEAATQAELARTNVTLATVKTGVP
ncbi:MAG: PhnD/SsuA/transferrin family substrate-binding protein [Verrucomicrobiia bacterium]|jgi:phosphonate transport system substrate-binding protein